MKMLRPTYKIFGPLLFVFSASFFILGACSAKAVNLVSPAGEVTSSIMPAADGNGNVTPIQPAPATTIPPVPAAAESNPIIASNPNTLASPPSNEDSAPAAAAQTSADNAQPQGLAMETPPPQPEPLPFLPQEQSYLAYNNQQFINRDPITAASVPLQALKKILPAVTRPRGPVPTAAESYGNLADYPFLLNTFEPLTAIPYSFKPMGRKETEELSITAFLLLAGGIYLVSTKSRGGDLALVPEH